MTTSTLPAHQRAKSTYLNLTLWTFQGWLAMFFIAAGYAKLTESMENLIILMQWPALTSESFVRGLGWVELVLAAMMLVPLVSWKIGRPLLVMASLGLMVLEAFMLVLHALDLSIGLALTNLLLLAITVPVFWYRRSR